MAFPIAFTSKKFVVIGNTEGVATIIGIQQNTNVLSEAYVATSHLINSYIIAIGIWQWVLFYNQNGLSTITYPITLSSKPWAIITTEGDPAGWNTANGIAIAGGDIKTASNGQANILTKWVLNGGTIKQDSQTIRALIIGI